MNQGRYAEAAEHLRLIHTQSPGNMKYTEMLAEALYQSKQNDELFRLLRSEAVESQNASDWIRLGQYAMKLGDKDTAKTALLSAVKVDGGRTWQPHVALYDYYRSMGQKGEAIERLRMAAFVAPNQPEVNRRIVESGAINGPTFPNMPVEWQGASATAEQPTK
jgi:tetratricopeptide (TPR) repeat protein